jgi:hypothetical protein
LEFGISLGFVFLGFGISLGFVFLGFGISLELVLLQFEFTSILTRSPWPTGEYVVP